MKQMKRQGSGSIVNVTSGAQTGMPSMTAYGATKAAVAAMTYTWALEAAQTGVRINAISPLAATQMAAYGEEYRRRTGETSAPRIIPPPEVNAPAICFLLSDVARQVNGQVLRIQGSRLSLMTHPAVCLPVYEADPWTVEKIAALFDSDLRSSLMPLGVAGVKVEIGDLETNVKTWEV
jgi:short-subunit dehydrogenase